MIKHKKKKCKGTGKAKGHGCGKENWKRTYGLGHECKCYQTWLLTTKEGKEIVKNRTLKVTKPRRELEKAEKEHKERQKLPQLLASTRDAVHRYIRERDKGKPCISCGQPWHKDFHAGHFYKAELYSILRFHTWNIHGQCPKCNLRLEGNLNNYELNLPYRIGESKFQQIRKIALANKHKEYKWDRQELIRIRNKANERYHKIKNKK